MAEWGSLLDGLVKGLQYKQERAMQQQESGLRNEYVKAQKKLLDAQVKQAELEENWWGTQPEHIKKIRFMPKEVQKLAFLMAGMQGLPDILGGTAQPSMPAGPQSYTEAISQAQPLMSMAGQPQAQGMPGAIPGMPQDGGGLLQMLAMGELSKMMPQFEPRTTAGEGGRPVTQFFTPWGAPVQGLSYPEPVKPERVERVDPRTGQTVVEYVDPYGQSGAAAQQEAAPMVTKPAEVETVTKQEGGVTYEQDINKVTRQPLGPPRVKEELKPEKAEQAAKLQQAQNAIDELHGIASNVFTDGDVNRRVLVEGAFNIPFSKGRTVIQAYQRSVEAVIRGLSGAAVPDNEMARYLEMYTPHPLDGKEAVVNKTVALERFLNGLAEQMDPTGRIRINLLGTAKSKPGVKPPKLGGKKESKGWKDYLNQ